MPLDLGHIFRKGNSDSSFEFEHLPIFKWAWTDKVNETLIIESISFIFWVLRLDLHSEPVISEEFSCNHIPDPERIAIFRTELVELLRNEFPETFVKKITAIFFEVVLCGFGQSWRNEPSFLSVLEINNIMWLYFCCSCVLFVTAMLDELPQTLILVLIHNGNTGVNWFLYWRTNWRKFEEWMLLWNFLQTKISV